ncbi:MAG: GNAT family N-acetyltransferase [Phycisphaerales bacterium]|nr:MAG: GNAT family N-acetyltransferase [Phycisphaerales bacterium]
MVEIRQVQTGKELQCIRAMLGEYSGSLEFDLSFQDFDEEIARLPGDYSPPEGVLLLAISDGEAAGCVGLRKLDERTCEMKRLYVKPQLRGLGIGRALVETLIEKTRGMGYTAMLLDTVPSMQIAKALYASLGFRRISPYRYNPIEGAVFMELRLGQ